ncbi:MAG: hypothetical protein ACLT0Y_04475 [Christensenellales bacterium]|jgi:uncharacterized protein (DUF305 family)
MQPSQTTTLLNDVFQNAQMGVDSTQRLIELVEDKPFQSVLIAQRNRYQDVYDRTLQLSDQELKGKKTLQKLSSTMMINLQTIKDKTPSHLAGMMIQGNTMGVIDMTKSLRENQAADPPVLALAQDLLSMQKGNIEEMKPYL